jgi:hypothetical protein
MSKGRSPNCPQISLEDALARARAVYKAEHTHVAERQVIASDMGYKSLNGASLTVIGALRQYGLLEDAEGGMRVSADAVAVIELPDSESEHKKALHRLAFNPGLFNELKEQFGEHLPSEANLRHSLIKKGFMPKAADDVIRVYRENIELVGAEQNGHNREEDEDLMESTGLASDDAISTKQALARKAAEKILEAKGPKTLTLPIDFDDEGNAILAQVQFSAPISRELLGKLREVLKTWEPPSRPVERN